MSETRPAVLVVEDEADIRRFVRLALEHEGLDVYEADTLKWALVEAGTRRPELIVLDLGMPDGDGMEFIREFRAWSNVPVLELSARGGESDKIMALDAGADDYVVKPFGAGELVARVRAQLRRYAGQTPAGATIIRFGRISVDLARRVVERDSQPVHLTPIEYRLLVHLIGQPERVITYRRLLEAVWGPGHLQDTHYVRVHMANLRKKLEADPSMPKHLLTEAGVGYRFVPGNPPLGISA